MRLGLNQRELATAVSLDFGYMSKIENKGLLPSRDVIEGLAKALKLHGEERDDFINLGGAIPEATEEIVRDPQARQLLRSLREMPAEARGRMLEQLIEQVRAERRGEGT